MRLTSTSFEPDRRIPEAYAFGAHDPASHIRLAANRNPQLAWHDLPSGTKSLVLVCHDYDVPSRPDDVNKEGRTIPASLPRVNFHHWVLVDLDPGVGAIADGEFSDGVIPRGKKGPEGPRGTRQGINDYTSWFTSDAAMAGDYYGYDGPCPPWNDTIPHHYVFTLYALDIDQCPVSGRFTGPDVLQAIKGHVLGQASVTGVYAINPDVQIR